MVQSITEEFAEMAKCLIDDCVDEPNAVWVSVNDGEVENTDEPWNITRDTNTVSHDIKIVFMQDRLEDRQLLKYLKGRVVNSGQVNAIMCPQGFDPELNDIVEWQGQELVVRAIDPVRPVDKPIIYVLEFGT